jgi:hypothetical protein
MQPKRKKNATFFVYKAIIMLQTAKTQGGSMTAPKKPQGTTGVDSTLKGYEVKAVPSFPRKIEGKATSSTSYVGPSAPPPSKLLEPTPPPSAPAQLAPQPPAISPVVDQTPPPVAYSNYSIEDVSAAANKLVQVAARDIPTPLSFVSTERILDALFEYWQEQSPFLRVVGTPPEGAWTYQDVIDGKVEIENDYAALLASAERLWIAQTEEATSRPEADYVNYIRELLTQRLDPDEISYYVDQERVSLTEVKLLQAFHDLASALLFYKSAQVVSDRADKIVMLTSGASMAGERALRRFGDMQVPPVIQQYSQTLLTLKIAPAIARIGMK